MNYPTFLKKIDQLAAKCDADSLRLFVHEIARTIPESNRQRFLTTLNGFCNGSAETPSEEKANAAQLSDQIDQILQALCEIQNGDRELESEYNEEWDDWNDNAEDEFRFADPFGVLDDVALAIRLLHDALDQEEYEKGAELAQRLSELNIQVSGDYEDAMGIRDLVSYDLLDINQEQTVKEAVYLAYMGTREPKCAEAMLMIMDNFADYSIQLEDVLQMGAEEIDLNALLPYWMEELAKRPEIKTDNLLKEAQDMLQDKNDILNYASRYAESHPILYQNILQKGLNDSSPEEMTRIGLQGMKEIPVNHKTRSEVSLLTAEYALKMQNRQTAETCWLEAIRSSPTVVNYLRLRLQSQCWEEYADMVHDIYASWYASRNQWNQKPLAALMFFDARFKEMIDRFMKPGKGIGWSSTFMKEGIALMLMLLDTGSGNRPGMTAMREIAIHACSFDCEKYRAGTDIVSKSTDSALFQECFDKWKLQTALPENARALWTAKIEQWIALRVSAIMDANRRNYYGECAEFIAALGEVQESVRPGYKDSLMQQYRMDYSRRRAFHDELRRYGMRK
jgi:hypothetical protein